MEISYRQPYSPVIYLSDPQSIRDQSLSLTYYSFCCCLFIYLFIIIIFYFFLLLFWGGGLLLFSCKYISSINITDTENVLSASLNNYIYIYIYMYVCICIYNLFVLYLTRLSYDMILSHVLLIHLISVSRCAGYVLFTMLSTHFTVTDT